MNKILWIIFAAFVLLVTAGAVTHYWLGWTTAEFMYYINIVVSKGIDLVVYIVDKIITLKQVV